jgi:phosphohistidine phosphatase
MLLYIVRHGIAVDVGQAGVARDADRMLSEEGHRRTKYAARGMQELDCCPQRIISSPLIRARETADIIHSVLAVRAPVEESLQLAPDARRADTLTWLERLEAVPTMLVGHMPDVMVLTSLLMGGESSLRFRFKKAAACCLSFPGGFEAGSGGLEWLMTPRALRLIGRAGR